MRDPQILVANSPLQSLIWALLFTKTGLVLLVGVVVLIIIAVAVGMSLETERLHQAAEAAADEIRDLSQKKKELAGLQRPAYCEHCPYRRPDDPQP